MSKQGAFGKVLSRSAIRPLNLGVLGTAIAAAIAVASWPIGVLGAAAYLALVATDLSNLEFRREVMFGRATPHGLPKLAAIADAGVREAVAAVGAARDEVDRVVKALPARVQRHVASTLRSIEELETHGATLALRGDELSRYLATVSLADVETEASQLARRAELATDVAARTEYVAAAGSAAERASALRDIVAARERILANLARIATAMRGVPTKLVRLRALDDQASDALTGDVGSELDRMNIDLRAFEDALVVVGEEATS